MVLAYPTLEKLLHLTLTSENYDLFSELLGQSIQGYLQTVKQKYQAHRG